ncbi:MAG: type II toxin-antitoxin system YoeB family toxin, partial [Pseudanabaena sp.]
EALRLIRMMRDVMKDPFEGIGKPKPLKHDQGWSRRVNEYDRLQYSVESNFIKFSTASGHYTGN